MPIYEYKCTKCKNHFEAMQKFSDSPISTCPSCGGQAKKQISRSAFHLKGAGWYMTDYAKKGGSKDSDSSSVSESSSSVETPSASKTSDSD